MTVTEHFGEMIIILELGAIAIFLAFIAGVMSRINELICRELNELRKSIAEFKRIRSHD